MATDRSYLDFILDQLAPLEEVTYRSMMGEYILYYRGQIALYVCDDRLLAKPVPSARRLMPEAPLARPYPGAKEMLLVERVDDREFLARLLREIYPELPEGKKKKR